MIRPRWIALGSLLLALSVTAAEPGVKVQFIGGTLSGMSPKTSARLSLTAADNLQFHFGATEMQIPYQRINTVEYGQSVSRR